MAGTQTPIEFIKSKTRIREIEIRDGQDPLITISYQVKRTIANPGRYEANFSWDTTIITSDDMNFAATVEALEKVTRLGDIKNYLTTSLKDQQLGNFLYNSAGLTYLISPPTPNRITVVANKDYIRIADTGINNDKEAAFRRTEDIIFTNKNMIWTFSGEGSPNEFKLILRNHSGFIDALTNDDKVGMVQSIRNSTVSANGKKLTSEHAGKVRDAIIAEFSQEQDISLWDIAKQAQQNFIDCQKAAGKGSGRY